ncbi:receptor-type tyrosine-protein phosphatase N2 isoform 2 precursor [Homo sapiens]|uniref:Isoform 4 of Receptor-type tyrosine-protein phosphatase N2 n=1 Tax=Homo sapiens TaxID=9606 RepID=Q92932-4|nr:receptor-type tyrosine-protein phosphatase N2 isoform 2 precursor [Homo sapiens]|eukprot:NP_570857.2 receptor-type tyrosine-protein phosphatase N2 isoform 2 precursor [Homo sapiens]
MGPPLPLLLLLLLLLPPRVLPAAPSSVPRGRQLPGRLDGVFGRCQKVPAMDFYRYEVSPVALQRLRVALQKLSGTGFTWQDDYTQYVMDQELADLPKTYLRRPEASSPARPSKHSVGSERRYSREGGAALANALRRHLPFLEALSQAPASDVLARTHTAQDRPPAEGDDRFSESILTYVAHTSALTYPPGSRTQLREDLLPRTLGQLQPDELSPKVDSGVDRHHLMAALSAYAAQRPPAPPGEGSLEPQYLLRAPSRMPRPLLAPAAPQKWPSPLGDSEDPSSTGDGARIHTLLKDLQRQPAEVRGLSGLELDGMAELMAGLMQGVDHGVARGSPGRAALGESGEQADGPKATLRGDSFPDDGVQDDDDRLYQEVHRLSATLGGLLQDHGSRLLPGALPFARPLDMERKKSEHPESSLSSEEETAGVENVKSQTYSKDLLGQQPHSEPGAAAFGELQNQMPGPSKEEQSLPAGAQEALSDGLQLEVQPSEEEARGYIVTDRDPLRPEEGRRLVEDVARLLQVPSSAFADVEVLGPAVTFKVSANVQNVTTEDVEKATVDNKDKLEETSGLKILQTGVGSKSKLKFLPPQAEQEDSTKFIALTLVSLACILGVLLASGLIYCLRHSSQHRLKEKLSGLGGDPGADATAAYQELCRQRMATRPPDRPEGPHTSRISSVSSQFSDGPIPSPSARSSASSWSEEPVQSNMDISTGHMILSYMEDHLKNKNRLEKEWEALCAYQAEPNSSFVAQREENVPKNRSLAVLTYDHSRVLLKAENSHSHSDYINASPIMDHDPRNPAYIATQGPLPATVADFWQMVWESGCVVIVMLTPLAENGVRQCYHYWPDEGSNLYHIYEVNLVSEHIWCEDFLVRSFYLKNLQTNETRTVTQFHFLSWYDRGVPSSSRSLLDFRRKVNKCYRGRSCPIIVHCSDGAGRSGTYVLIDMVLNKMAKGAKEIDIAATLEHLRDQRPGMVQTKEQFEFALTAVAEEVNAILKALPQ